EMRGAPIPNAQVAIAGRSTVTNAAGQFTFADVPPGQYPVTVNAPGATLYQAPPAVSVVPGDVAEVPTIFLRGPGTAVANAGGSTYLIATPGRVAEFNRTWQA